MRQSWDGLFLFLRFLFLLCSVISAAVWIIFLRRLTNSPVAWLGGLLVVAFNGVVITLRVHRFTPDAINDGTKQGREPLIHVTARIALSAKGSTELATALNKLIGTKAGAISSPLRAAILGAAEQNPPH